MSRALTVAELRSALLDFPDYYEVDVASVDEDGDPNHWPVSRVDRFTDHAGPKVVLA